MARMLLALFLAVVPAAAQAGTLIDSFTHELPPNFWLQQTQRPILFLGSQCDGVACPPSSVVTFPNDQAITEQDAVPGTISPRRLTSLVRQHPAGPPDQGVLRIDPANGGSMVIEGASGAGLFANELWGDVAHPLNLDLTADGSDHFEVDILATATLPDDALFEVDLWSSSGQFGTSAPGVGGGPGTISVPYTRFPGLAPIVHDIDVIQLILYIPSGTPPPFVVGEFRTANTPSPAVPKTWGRIKDDYRR